MHARALFGTGMTALRAGKHVLVEQPLADSLERGQEMAAEADAKGVVLMANKAQCFEPAVQKMQKLVGSGSLGDILFVEAVRTESNLARTDRDVFWDLAPHDLAIIDFLLPGGLRPMAVSAVGADPLGSGKACVGYLTLPLQNGAIAHVHVNWLSPTKVRQMIIGGTRRTLVWDDLNPQQRLSVYDRGVDIDTVSKVTTADTRAANISYRLGDTWSPALPEGEALAGVATEFAAAIREGRSARTSGKAGLRVLSVLEAAARSVAAGGAPLAMGAAATNLEMAR